MHDFALYFNLGLHHIIDLRGLDHLLFLCALCIRYRFTDWKHILILVTAFTIGHSATLVLSVLRVVHYPTPWVEFLIPLTIVITAISNMFVRKFSFKKRYPGIYFTAMFFGLIHGLGFSNYLKSILGRNNSIFVQLFSFNIGLEVGQILIVLAILILTQVLLTFAKVNRREYLLFVNGGILALALKMAIEKIPF